MKKILGFIIFLILVGVGISSGIMNFVNSAYKDKIFHEFYARDYQIKNNDLKEIYQEWIKDTKEKLEGDAAELSDEIKLYEEKKSAGVEGTFDKPSCDDIFTVTHDFIYWKNNEKANIWKQRFIQMQCIVEELKNYEKWRGRDIDMIQISSSKLLKYYTLLGDKKNIQKWSLISKELPER